jgi:transposase
MKAEQVQALDVAACVGMDWADQRHVVCLKASDSTQTELSELPQEPEALHNWVAELRSRFGGRKVAIALEQSRGAVIHALMTYDFLILYPINPMTLSRYRQAFATSGAKDDPSDAALLLALIQSHRDQFRPWIPDDVQTRTIQLLVEHRRTIVEERVRLSNRLTSLLKGYFPQALEWVGEIDSLQACGFLSKWPTLPAVQKARPSLVRKFYHAHGCRRQEVIEDRLAAIVVARPLTEDPAVIAASTIMVRATVEQLRPLIQAIDELNQKLQELYLQHPDRPLYESLPGAGEALEPRLLAALGTDRDRFASALEVQQFSGIAPVTKKSGNMCHVHRRYACPRFIKQTFHEFANQSIRRSVWARAYYDQQRQKGKGHHAAIRSLAYKWIRIIYSCWRDRTQYDEQLYLQALRRRNSPLLSWISSGVPAGVLS